MRKLAVSLLLFSLALILFGCGKKSDAQKIKAWLIDTVPAATNENLALPATHPELGGTITYRSLTPDVLNDKGQITLTEAGTKPAELEVTITKEAATVTFKLKIKVTSTGRDLAGEIAAWLETVIPQETTENLTLPATHPQLGGEIIWVSADPLIMTDSGEITLTGEVKAVKLEATVIVGGQAATKELSVTVIAITIEEIATKFTAQFSPIILRDFEISTELVPGAVISWESSNQEVFTNEGKYIRPVNDVQFTVTYKIEFLGKEQSGAIELTAQGIPGDEKAAEAFKWIDSEVLYDRYITQAIKLPTHFEKYDLTINWESSNEDVVNAETGQIKPSPFERRVKVMAKVKQGTAVHAKPFNLVIAPVAVSTTEEKLTAFVDAIAISKLRPLKFNNYNDINPYFNHLFFFTSDDPVIHTTDSAGNSLIVPDGTCRKPDKARASTEFIAIHDTAGNNAWGTGLGWAKYLLNFEGADGKRQVSWHFCTDQHGSWQSVPIDEIAWHGGDGGRNFGLIDTGVPVTLKYPHVEIDPNDGYFYINGQKSKIAAERSDTGEIVTKTSINGIYINSDGTNYMMNKSYYNKDYRAIANAGGNNYSVAFESAVDIGSDYVMTLRHLARHTATLLMQYDLSLDRVRQHNAFSGKPCPWAIQRAEWWSNFLDLVSLNRYGYENFKDFTFEWKGLSGTFIDDLGRIDNILTTRDSYEIKYKVKVTYSENGTPKVFEKEFTTTTLKG